ncbi:MarR family winged helix-turn-helix transcriptional regulator [Enterococcus sp. AZ109]|uniref:MarR family winged helix-turn-helix transcriptional regulator n=1 Tax=Enterococcus sp. AZ109 TaxID=2774634 RepID=UPI003F262703
MEFFRLKQEIFRSSHLLKELMQDAIIPICEEYGLTLQQFMILAELEREPDLMAGQLSKRVGILKSNFATVRKKLEEKQLIEHHRDEKDQRVFALRLTNEGHQLFVKINAKIDEKFALYFNEDAEDSFKKILEGLNELQDLLTKYQKRKLPK